MYKLFGYKGCGSTAIEALLELMALPYEGVQLEWAKARDWDELKRWNPLGQVPTLVTSEGQVLTESAAIILWLLDRHPDTALMPASGSAASSFLSLAGVHLRQHLRRHYHRGFS